jgi:hypothetical protein
VAWCKRKIFRKSWTHEDCGPQKDVTAAGRKVTCCAGHIRKEQNKDDVSPRSPKGGTFDRNYGEARNAKRAYGAALLRSPYT